MSRTIAPVTLFAGLGLLAWSLAAGAAVGPAPAEDAQKIVYFSEGGPVLIELRLSIDGQPLGARHRAFLDALFDDLDRNRDGVLSRAEAATAPPAAVLSSPLGVIFLARRGDASARLVPDRDGRVTREGLASHYRRAGLRAFQLSEGQFLPARALRVRADSGATADQLTDRLFRLLDTDRDGLLSAKELEAAPAILGKVDADGDEMITPDEVMGDEGGPGLPLTPPRLALPTTTSRWLHVIPEGEDEDEILAQALLERYGKKGATSLPADQPWLSKEDRKLLDRDCDGLLSGEELARFGSTPAAVTLTIKLGKRSGEPVMSVQRDRPLPAGVEAKGTPEGVTLRTARTAGASRLDIVSSAPPEAPVPVNLRDQFKALFRMLDSNSDGSLDRKEARGFFATLFDAIDGDGDGKITEKELLAYLDRMEALGKLAGRSCVSLTFSSEGKGLFEVLDGDGDGRLSVRELRNARRVLAALDANGDGKLARHEVPHQHRAALALGPGGPDPFRRVAVATPARGGPRPVARRAGPAGPLWFQKMDSNRDGDVSRKEFVGTDEQFRQIDTDGDGLISAEEADRYDRRKHARE